jgi:hypothetical protein
VFEGILIDVIRGSLIKSTVFTHVINTMCALMFMFNVIMSSVNDLVHVLWKLKLLKQLDNCQVADILSIVTHWLLKKGTAQQLIDWVNGLQREEEALFSALHAATDVSQKAVSDDDFSPVISSSSSLFTSLSAEPDEGEASDWEEVPTR